MNDWVASYLLKENYLLTALEFYQELKESGQEQVLLSKLFKHKEYNEENFVEKQKQTEIGLPPNLIASDGNAKILQSQITKKDEKINVLQYEIRILKSDIDKLKQQLSETVQKSHVTRPKRREKSDSPSSSSTSPSNDVKGVGLQDILGNDHVSDFSHQQSLMDAHHGTQSQEGTAKDSENEDDDLLQPSNLRPVEQQEKQVRFVIIVIVLHRKLTKISCVDY
jgi:hypothetical protein